MSMTRKGLTLLLTLALTSVGALAQTAAVELKGSNEVPANDSAASGSGTITVGADKAVSGSVTTTGIEGRGRAYSHRCRRRQRRRHRRLDQEWRQQLERTGRRQVYRRTICCLPGWRLVRQRAQCRASGRGDSRAVAAQVSVGSSNCAACFVEQALRKPSSLMMAFFMGDRKIRIIIIQLMLAGCGCDETCSRDACGLAIYWQSLCGSAPMGFSGCWREFVCQTKVSCLYCILCCMMTDNKKSNVTFR